MRLSTSLACALAAVAFGAAPAAAIDAQVSPTGTEKVTISLTNNRTLPGACVLKFSLSSGAPDTYYAVSRLFSLDGTPWRASYSGVTNSRGSLSQTLGNALKTLWATAVEEELVISIIDDSGNHTPVPTASISLRNRCTP